MSSEKYRSIHFSEIDSTNSYAKRLPFSAENDYLIITADNQTAGYGRSKKKWVSGTVDNIACTLVLLNPPHPMQNYNEAICLAIASTMSKYQEDIKIKWPNDILKSRKKIAGILLEVQYSEEQTRIIIGFGINRSVDGLNAVLLNKVSHIGSTVSKNQIIAEILNDFENRLQSHQYEVLHQQYLQEIQWMVGSEIEFEEKAYRIIGFSEKNAIIIADDVGKEKTVYAGDISLQNFYQNIK